MLLSPPFLMCLRQVAAVGRSVPVGSPLALLPLLSIPPSLPRILSRERGEGSCQARGEGRGEATPPIEKRGKGGGEVEVVAHEGTAVEEEEEEEEGALSVAS